MAGNQNKSTIKTGIQLNELLVLLCILGIWLAFNLLTASRSPIIEGDEVLYTDPSANLYFGNGFTSTGWYAQSSDQFWAGNVPLHQVFLYYWIRIFGFNPISVRSINYIYIVGVAVIIWLTTIRLDLIKKQISRLALVFLILTDYGITYSYRSGRSDIICILLCSLIFLSYSIRNKLFRYISISILSVLFPFAGLQLVIYSFALGTVLICFLKREVLKEFLIVQFSSLFGFLMLISLYVDKGVLKAFFLSIAPHSKLINNLIDNSNLAYDLVGDPSIQDKFTIIGLLIKPITFLLRDYSSVCVLICLLMIIGYQVLQKQFTFKSSACFGVIQIIIISGVLSIVGKTPAYYSWMIFIPATISLLITYESYNFYGVSTKKITKIIIISNLILLIFASSGMFTRIFFKWERADYSKVEEFVIQNITKDDIVFCDEQAYYPAKIHAKKIFLPPYLKFISSTEKENISVLIISPDSSISFNNSRISFNDIPKLIGGQWELKNSINQSPSNSFNIAKVRGYNLQVFKRI
jgi:hypothetical protein